MRFGEGVRELRPGQLLTEPDFCVEGTRMGFAVTREASPEHGSFGIVRPVIAGSNGWYILPNLFVETVDVLSDEWRIEDYRPVPEHEGSVVGVDSAEGTDLADDYSSGRCGSV